MNNKNVEVIAPTSKTMCLKGNVKYKLIRTCAYCRVSTDNEDQKTSYDSQRIHYKNMIEENPDWEFVGIYADEGITGTQTKKREQFNQMMNDALNGKIDLILAKSISRFARNTVDTLNCVRLLREHNVDVFFEKENIHTLGLSNELFLTLYSAFAQAESESISENVKAGVRMKMKRGELVGKYAPFGYLYDKEKDIITPDESKKDIVTYIFEEYSKGVGFRTIALNLNNLGIPSPSNLKWCHASVRRIITNEKYVGDLKTGKYYTENVLTHKKKVNYGEKEQYFTSNHHEPIISRELWDKCQEILNIRSKMINKIAAVILGVYLIHDNTNIRYTIYKYLNIDNGQPPGLESVLYALIYSLLILIVCLLIEIIRSKITILINNKNFNKRKNKEMIEQEIIK